MDSVVFRFALCHLRRRISLTWQWSLRSFWRMNCPSCGHENIDGIDRCENCLAPFRQLDIPSADAAEGLARSVMEDNLNQLEQDLAISVAPDTPALEVARLMKNANSGCALVVDGAKLVGIFTEHDVLLKMTAAPG